jgi:hypothetical protein
MGNIAEFHIAAGATVRRGPVGIAVGVLGAAPVSIVAFDGAYATLFAIHSIFAAKLAWRAVFGSVASLHGAVAILNGWIETILTVGIIKAASFSVWTNAPVAGYSQLSAIPFLAYDAYGALHVTGPTVIGVGGQLHAQAIAVSQLAAYALPFLAKLTARHLAHHIAVATVAGISSQIHTGAVAVGKRPTVRDA